MSGNYGLDTGGNVVIQEPVNKGSGPATRLEGGGASFSGFGQAPQAPGGDFGAAAKISMRTLEAVNKLTEGILNPLIERKQKQQYFEGMAQVAQGKTLLEVEKNQPWYTQIFGPSATVQGAQAMTLMASMNDAENQFYQALPELSEKSPDHVRAWLVEQASEFANTGDPMMDAMVQAKLVEQMGPMTGQHLKQHLKYVQDQNNIAYGNGLVTAGDVLQRKQEQEAYMDPAQMELETARAVESFQKVPGMTQDAWQSNTVKALSANMMKGNFSIWEAFKKTDQYQELPVESRTHLETQIEPYASQWVQRNLPSYLDDVHNIAALSSVLLQGGGPPTPDSLDKWLDAQNESWAVQSGSSTPLFDNNERVQMHMRQQKGWDYLAKLEASSRASGDKIEGQYRDAIAQRTVVGHMLDTGRLPPNHSALEPANVQMELQSRREDIFKAGDPTAMTNHMKKLAVSSLHGSKYMDQDLSVQMTAAANNFLQQGMAVSEPIQEQLRNMAMMAQAPSGLSALANYVGAENATKMTALLTSGVDLTDLSAVDIVRTSIQRGWNAEPSAKDVRQVNDFLDDNDTLIQKYLPLFGEGVLTGFDLNKPSKERLSSLLAPTVARLQKGLGLGREEAIKFAFSQKFSDPSKIDYVDGTFTEPSPASSFKSMFHEVSRVANISNQASEDYRTALSNVIDRSMGFDVDKQPDPEVRRRSKTQVAGDIISTVAKEITKQSTLGQVLGLGSGSAGGFDTGEYQTLSATLIGNGILQVHRAPLDITGTSRPVVVTISAEQVIDELDRVYKRNAEKAKTKRKNSQEWTDRMLDRTID